MLTTSQSWWWFNSLFSSKHRHENSLSRLNIGP